MPRNGVYLIPLKDKVRKAEGVTPDANVTVHVVMVLR